jgi:Ribbon-helix-helix domain
MPESIRWTIKVSPDTDLSLRTFLGAKGMKKGDISRFVEDAVRWRMLDRTVQGIKNRNQDIPSTDLDSIIDRAVSSVRASRAIRPKTRPRVRR